MAQSEAKDRDSEAKGQESKKEESVHARNPMRTETAPTMAEVKAYVDEQVAALKEWVRAEMHLAATGHAPGERADKNP